MDITYQELHLNDRRWIDLTINRDTGLPYAPSAATYFIRGHDNQNTIVSETQATINGNVLSAKVTETITASAAEYDLVWKIEKEGNTDYHCTRLLVNEC